jgi:hypothetical protein
MKLRNIIFAGLWGACALAGAAQAAQVLYDGSGIVQGQQSFSDTFTVSGPGALTVTLTNVAWPEPLSSLKWELGSPAVGLLSAPGLGSYLDAGSDSFALTAAGQYTLDWFATAQGSLDTGSYTLNVEFQPSGVLPVPLPTSIALLLSGLALLGWQRRTRRMSADSEVHLA